MKKAGLFFLLLSTHSNAENGELYFDTFALETRVGGIADLDNIVNRGGQPAGKYLVDLYLNGDFKETRSVNFKSTQDGNLLPELTVNDYEDLGVKIREVDALRMRPGDSIILRLDENIKESSTYLDLGQQRLDVNIPQIYIRKSVGREVDSRRWDQGIPAAIVNYNVNGFETRTDVSLKNKRYASLYANLRPGLNMGPWRLRNDSAYTRNRTHTHWRSMSTYLQRDWQAIGGQIQLGKTRSKDSVFDGVVFEGLQAYSDDSMLPDSMQGFAPVIRGVSVSGGHVSIRQNGYLVYQENVPPGPFAITELYALASRGELEVTVKENDGTKRRFTQAFSSVPMMQREGKIIYSIVAGEYRSTSPHSRAPAFFQGSSLFGVNNHLTLIGGSQLSANYQSILLGHGVGLGRWGSLSLDVTHASTRLQDDSRHQGQSYRLQYAKDIFQSGTTFTLVGHRYNTSGFYDFREANEISPRLQRDNLRSYNRRNRAELQLNQSLQTWGSLFVSAYRQDYWRMSGADETYSLGYSGNLGPISVGVSYNRITQSAYQRSLLDEPDQPNVSPSSYRKAEKVVSLTLSLPLGHEIQSPRLNSMVTTDNLGQTRFHNGASGTLTKNNAASYSIYHTYGNRDEGNGIGGNLDYHATYARLNSGYNLTPHGRTSSYGLSGGMVIHENGMTFSPEGGDGFTLISAPGVSGVAVDNQPGVKTDWRGYAVISNPSAYRQYVVSLDTASLPDNAELTVTSARVVPTRGAVVRANFEPRIGERLLLRLHHASGAVPFGAVAQLRSSEGKEIGTAIVGDNSEVYLSGVPERSEVRISWGKKTDQQCRADLGTSNDENKVTRAASAIERRAVQCL